jgi:hypothetical protein
MRQARNFKDIGIGIVVGAALATVLGVAAHNGDTTKIHACVDPSGNLRIIGPDENCRRNETALDWNVQGVKGDQGDTGSNGPKGDKGDTGEVGPAGTFAGTFTSGAYSLTVADAGIFLVGPRGSISLGPDGIVVDTDRELVLQGNTVHLRSDTAMELDAALIAIRSAGDLRLKGNKIDEN